MKKPCNVVRPIALTFCLCASPFALSQAQNITTLDPIIISASRIIGPKENQPFGTSVITSQEIIDSGAQTINEAIVQILGAVARLDVSGGNEYSIDLRGFGITSGDNQVIIVDGIRLNEGDSSSARLSGIPIESVKQIEVIRGAGTVLYGEGATAGVIVITTKAGAGAQRKNTATLHNSIGSNGLVDIRAHATLQDGGFSLDLTGNTQQNDGHRLNSDAKSHAASAAAQWTNDTLRLVGRISQDTLKAGLPGGLSFADYQTNPSTSNKPNDHGTIDNLRYSLLGELSLDSVQLSLDLGKRTKQVDSVFSNLAYGYDVEAQSANLRAKHAFKTKQYSNIMLAGLDHTQWSRVDWTQSRQTANAVYVRDEFSWLSSQTHLSAGLRSESINKDTAGSAAKLDDRLTAWELGLNQSITPALSSYIRYANSYRLANLDEYTFTLPATSLVPQLSRDAEIGLRFANAGFKLDARLYKSALKNEIGFDPILFANVNFDPTTRHGLELDASYKITPALNLQLHGAMRRSYFSAGPYNGKDIALTPRRSMSISTQWKPASTHSVTGGINWVGTQYADFDNKCRMPSYYTGFAKYGYQWSNVNLSVGINNLFNAKYYSQAFTCDGGTGTVGGIYPEVGRTFNASLRIAF